jgi:hypothetical protein
MQTILDLLIKTLIERFSDAGFDVPETMTQKESESFVFVALENAVVLRAAEHERLVTAARHVVTQWESTSLAEAVRNLDSALGTSSPAMG